MEVFLVPVAASFLGSLGFSMYYKVDLRLSALNAAFAAVGYFLYVVLRTALVSEFWSNLWTAAFLTVMTELLARLLKVPTTLMLVPMLFPELPGSDLYNMAHSLFTGDLSLSVFYGRRLAIIIAALNFGIVLITTIVKIYTNIFRRTSSESYKGYR